MVLNQEYYTATKEAYLPKECEFYGNNEMGGLDGEGNPHCDRYVDELVKEED